MHMMIHRYWQGSASTVNFIDRLRELNPGVEIQDWSPSTLPVWVSELASMSADRVVEHRQAQHWANVARIGLLVEYGGWWADWDLNPKVPFASLPFPATAAHGDRGFRCNCWMAAPAADAGMTALAEDLKKTASREFHGVRRRCDGCVRGAAV